MSRNWDTATKSAWEEFIKGSFPDIRKEQPDLKPEEVTGRKLVARIQAEQEGCDLRFG